MNNILVMIRKQMKDTFKNKAVLIQLILLPVVAFVLERVIRPEGVPELMYTKMFAAMYMAMAPLTAMSSIIAEEKEKNTLRVLMMSNVKPGQYLTGIGAYVKEPDVRHFHRSYGDDHPLFHSDVCHVQRRNRKGGQVPLHPADPVPS